MPTAQRSFAVARTPRCFFSSRRRHTRYWRDWSSDVCSSDLPRRRFPSIRGGLPTSGPAQPTLRLPETWPIPMAMATPIWRNSTPDPIRWIARAYRLGSLPVRPRVPSAGVRWALGPVSPETHPQLIVSSSQHRSVAFPGCHAPIRGGMLPGFPIPFHHGHRPWHRTLRFLCVLSVSAVQLSLSRAGLLPLQLHRLGVPQADFLVEIADVGQQRRTGGAESEYRVFHHRLAAAHRGDEVAVMVERPSVALRGHELFLGRHLAGIDLGPRRVLLPVLLEELLLLGFREGVDGMAGFQFARHFGKGHAVLHRHDAFAADEPQPGGFARAIHEIDAQHHIEAGVIVERDHHIGDIAAILPEAQAAGGVHAVGAERPCHEVQSADQMDEEIAGHAGAVVAVVAPAE